MVDPQTVLMVVMATAIGCGTNARDPISQPDASVAEAPLISDPHAVGACGPSWTLPIGRPTCESACVERVALVPISCTATHPNGAYMTCTETFAIRTLEGTVRGCCGLYGALTIPPPPSLLIFLACP